jgi:hypothetical protein
MRPHPKRTSTNTRSPRGWGTCDRSGFITNHEKLVWQFEWAGTQLINKRILVAPDMLDKPQRQLGTIILPPDPVSLLQARPEQYGMEEPTPPLFTYLSAAVLAGSTTLPVDSVTGFSPTNTVLVQLANGQFAEEKIVTVDAIGIILHVDLPLPANAPEGGTVTVATLTPPPP